MLNPGNATDTQSIETPKANGDPIKVIIERMPSPTVTYYHVNRRLTSGNTRLHFVYGYGQVRLEEREAEVEPFALQLAERIFRIEGITSDPGSSPVQVGQYQLRVSKGRAFGDEPIEFGVINALADVFGIPVGMIDIEIDSYKRSDEYTHRQRMSRPGRYRRGRPS